MVKWKWWLVGAFGIVIVIGGIWWFLSKQEIISPLIGGKKFGVFFRDKMEVVGFLPTWMVGKTQNYDGVLDELIFLGVDVGDSGNLIWDSEGKKINHEKYLEMKQIVKKDGGKNVLGLKLFDSELIDRLVASESARKVLIEETKAIIEVAEFDGINMDFEYMGDPLRVLEDDFIAFMADFKEKVGTEISLDVFANTVIKGDGEKLLKLANSIDKIIVMAYDFHQTSSDFVGPVAPIGSKPEDRNITEVTAKIIEIGLPKKKIVMAYPLYGYQWRTVDQNFESEVSENWGRMVSWRESKERIEEGVYENFSDYKLNWDELSMTPWVSFKNEETTEKWVLVKKKWKKVTVPITRIYQAYFENMESMKAKLDLAKQTQVGGVGFWALGYEGEDKELWKMVLEKIEY